MSPREHSQHQRVNAVQDRPQAFGPRPANVVEERQREENREYHDGGNIILQHRNSPTGHAAIAATTAIEDDFGKSERCYAPACPRPIGSDRR